MIAEQAHFRPVTRSDFDFLWALNREVYKAHVDAIWGWNETEQKQSFTEAFLQSDTDRRVIEIAGWAVGELELEHRADVLFVANVKIKPEMQSRGIGREIFGHLKSVATMRNATIELLVFRTNFRAMSFYRQQGFEEVGQTGTHRRFRWALAPKVDVI